MVDGLHAVSIVSRVWMVDRRLVSVGSVQICPSDMTWLEDLSPEHLQHSTGPDILGGSGLCNVGISIRLYIAL